MKIAAVLGLAFCFGGLTSLLLCSIVFGRERDAALKRASENYQADMGSCVSSLKSCADDLNGAISRIKACR